MWFDAFSHCYDLDGLGQFVRSAWPDGTPYINQDNLVVEMFDVIRLEREKMVEAKRKQKVTMSGQRN